MALGTCTQSQDYARMVKTSTLKAQFKLNFQISKIKNSKKRNMQCYVAYVCVYLSVYRIIGNASSSADGLEWTLNLHHHHHHHHQCLHHYIVAWNAVTSSLRFLVSQTSFMLLQSMLNWKRTMLGQGLRDARKVKEEWKQTHHLCTLWKWVTRDIFITANRALPSKAIRAISKDWLG